MADNAAMEALRAVPPRGRFRISELRRGCRCSSSNRCQACRRHWPAISGSSQGNHHRER